MGLALVREDRAGRTAGGPVVGRPARLGSYVRNGEPLTASKWETGHKISPPEHRKVRGIRETTGLQAGSGGPASG